MKVHEAGMLMMTGGGIKRIDGDSSPKDDSLYHPTWIQVLSIRPTSAPRYCQLLCHISIVADS